MLDSYGNWVADPIPLTPNVPANPSTGGAPDNITYSGPPLLSPPDIQYIVVDLDGRQWQYVGGSWQ